MKRMLGSVAVILAMVLVTGCQIKVPGVRQAANPCTALGTKRLAHLAHAHGTVSQHPVPVFSQAQVCEFTANKGAPVMILGTWDASHVSFSSELSRATGRFHGTDVHAVKIPGTTEAATMLGTFNNVRVPVLIAAHGGFLSTVLVVTRMPSRAPRLERAIMMALARTTG